MTQSGSGRALAAVFPDTASAEACAQELKRNGFPSPWLAVTKAATDEGPSRHEIASASDGTLGSIGRFFSGTSSLRRALVDQGLPEDEAAEIDESIQPETALVVVSPGDRLALAADILDRATARGFGGAVAGQADELDRGTGRGSSGGGLGASTGFTDDSAAAHDLEAGEVEDVIFYQRRLLP
jgi:hypothetical protein